eukprot:522503-Amphidinium_carterae.1
MQLMTRLGTHDGNMWWISALDRCCRVGRPHGKAQHQNAGGVGGISACLDRSGARIGYSP